MRIVEILGAGAGTTLPLQPVGKAERRLKPPQPVGRELDRLADAAMAAYPELGIERVLMPFPGMKSVGFQGSAGTVLVTEKANAVFVDPASGEVALKVVGDDLNPHQRIAEMADPLHFGTFGGLATKLIWFAFGCGLSALSITGVMIYALRIAGPKAERPAWIVAAKGLGWWASPASALIVIAAWLTPAVLAG